MAVAPEFNAGSASFLFAFMVLKVLAHLTMARPGDNCAFDCTHHNSPFREAIRAAQGAGLDLAARRISTLPPSSPSLSEAEETRGWEVPRTRSLEGCAT